MNVRVGITKPQKLPTSQNLDLLQDREVTLLTEAFCAFSGCDIEAGESAFARLHVDGQVYLYGHPGLGGGYELIKNAIEGVHYEFFD